MFLMLLKMKVIAFNSLLDVLINGKPINHIQNLVTKDFENETCEMKI